MENTGSQLSKEENQDQEIAVILNDQCRTRRFIPLKTLCKKSTLFKNMFEILSTSQSQSNEQKSNPEINLKLERPDLFCDLLRYLETGQLSGNSNSPTLFVNYIHDVNYLGMEELEYQKILSIAWSINVINTKQMITLGRI
eukprot:TRINITY_DN10415_c0_g1_i5.p1 TRINITY_DN10415_c0_g1~~TRINITY_DN10415_c0_g1_i5.p1  ORF type:complete len:154 (+),score=5.89 TRINITY_DN10415_c0_g1_i5:41-463(+)